MLTHHHIEPRDPARVVVLGANGFVGRALVAHLAAQKISAVGLGRKDINLTTEDAAERLAALLHTDDTLIFLSAVTPDKGRGVAPFLDNLRMGAAVCAAIERRPVGHLIYISSDAVYPFHAGLVNETSCAEPIDLYGAMHLARELMMKQATKAPAAVLRPTLIYGVGDTHNSYGPNRFRRAARKDKRIALFGEGEETRDHISIDDVVALIDLVIRHRSAGLLNLATGQSISYADLAHAVAKLFDEPVGVSGAPRQNPVTHRSFDITTIRQAFPRFSFTPLAAGLAVAHAKDAAD